MEHAPLSVRYCVLRVCTNTCLFLSASLNPLVVWSCGRTVSLWLWAMPMLILGLYDTYTLTVVMHKTTSTYKIHVLLSVNFCGILDTDWLSVTKLNSLCIIIKANSLLNSNGAIAVGTYLQIPSESVVSGSTRSVVVSHVKVKSWIWIGTGALQVAKEQTIQSNRLTLKWCSSHTK